MARSQAKLRLVEVQRTMTAPKKAKKRPTYTTYEEDPIFFTMGQVHVGALLTHVGRKSPQTSWRVTRIVSHQAIRGEWRPKKVLIVEHMSDRIYLRRVDAPATFSERSATFSYLSYSAIWRIQ